MKYSIHDLSKGDIYQCKSGLYWIVANTNPTGKIISSIRIDGEDSVYHRLDEVKQIWRIF